MATSIYHSSIKIFDGTAFKYLIARFVFGALTDIKGSFAPKPEEPDLTKIGNCSFGANGVLVRNMSFSIGGFVRYGQVNIGDKTMILDRAVILPDVSVEENVMIGPITLVDEDTAQEKDTLLLGTPAMCLNRKMSEAEIEITSEPLVSENNSPVEMCVRQSEISHEILLFRHQFVVVFAFAIRLYHVLRILDGRDDHGCLLRRSSLLPFQQQRLLFYQGYRV